MVYVRYVQFKSDLCRVKLDTFQELAAARAIADATRRELVAPRREIEENGVALSQTRHQCEICLEEFTDVAGNRAPKVLRKFLTGFVKS